MQYTCHNPVVFIDKALALALHLGLDQARKLYQMRAGPGANERLKSKTVEFCVIWKHTPSVDG